MEPTIMNLLDDYIAHTFSRIQNGLTGQSADDVDIESGEYELVRCIQEERDGMGSLIIKLRGLHH